MQKADNIPSDGTKADSSTKDENLQSSSHDTKPNVVGSQSHSTSIESVQPISNEIIFKTSPIDYKIVEQLYSNTIKLIKSKKLSKSFIADSLMLQEFLLRKCL